MTMIQILRCKKLAATASYCVVSATGAGELGRTPVVKATADPVWPPGDSTFAVPVGVDVVTVRICGPGAMGSDVPLGAVRLELGQLLKYEREHYPNCYPNSWWQLAPTDGCETPEGKIQVRAVMRREAKEVREISKAPSMGRLTCGPGLDAGLLGLGLFASDSEEKVLGLIARAHAPVVLHVYDVGRCSKIGSINSFGAATRAGGVFHGAIEIYNKEYTFAGSKQRMPGIFSNNPRKCPFHTYRESIFLGDSRLSRQQALAVLNRMSPDWMAPTYNLLCKNCCFFSKELAVELGVGTIPKWVYDLANVGAGLQSVFGKKPLPVLPTPIAHRAEVSPIQSQSTGKHTIDVKFVQDEGLGDDDGEDPDGGDPDDEPYRGSIDPGQSLMDDCMAARVQSTVRAKFGRAKARSQRSLRAAESDLRAAKPTPPQRASEPAPSSSAPRERRSSSLQERFRSMWKRGDSAGSRSK